MFRCFMLGSDICLCSDIFLTTKLKSQHQVTSECKKTKKKKKQLKDQVVPFPSNQKMIHSTSFAMCSFLSKTGVSFKMLGLRWN